MYFGNALENFGEAALWFIGLWIVFWVVQSLVLGRLKHLASKTQTDLDDTMVTIVENFRPQIYFVVAIYFAIRTLTLSSLVSNIVNGALAVAIVWQAVSSLQILLEYLLKRRLQQTNQHEDKTFEAALGIISLIARIVLWILAVLFVLSNFGVDVTSLLAGLGIGGIAVALALQNIFSDLFSSLAIYLDRPFNIGDTIKVKDTIGSVKYIGVKTTRIKALSGEEVVFSNRELTSAKIQNFKKIKERRVAFNLGVTYETDLEKLKIIPELAQTSIEPVDKTRFGRAHFKAFGDSALIFEIVFYVTVSDYDVYMDVQQKLLFNLMEKLRSASIEIAYPTQTIHIRNE